MSIDFVIAIHQIKEIVSHHSLGDEWQVTVLSQPEKNEDHQKWGEVWNWGCLSKSSLLAFWDLHRLFFFFFPTFSSRNVLVLNEEISSGLCDSSPEIWIEQLKEHAVTF